MLRLKEWASAAPVPRRDIVRSDCPKREVQLSYMDGPKILGQCGLLVWGGPVTRAQMDVSSAYPHMRGVGTAIVEQGLGVLKYMGVDQLEYLCESQNVASERIGAHFAVLADGAKITPGSEYKLTRFEIPTAGFGNDSLEAAFDTYAQAFDQRPPETAIEVFKRFAKSPFPTGGIGF